MNNDRSTHKYRKSPPRQYTHDPLQSQPLSANGRSEDSPRSEPLNGYNRGTDSLDARRSSGPLAQRPDPRRTRQLLRQQILATRKNGEDTGHIDPDINLNVDPYEEPLDSLDAYEDEVDTTLYSNRRARFGANRGYSGSSRRPAQREEGIIESPTRVPFDDELDYLDPDVGYDEEEQDPLAGRVGYAPETDVPARGYRRSQPLEYDDEAYEEEEELPPAKPERQSRPKQKKGGVSRRKLIAGAVIVTGGAIAAYELGPKIPGALQSAGTNIEHQIQDAFNRGLAAGEEAARKELINGLDALEGVSLDAAINAAKLTRTAYDVFVSPIITLAATIADDFLQALLSALLRARSWLANINADNATLIALTNILQSWVNQVHTMPKKLQTITETDLDGAQAYLNSLKRKIQEEQARLNGQKPSSTPTTTPKQ